jgi:hypothetical protein
METLIQIIFLVFFFCSAILWLYGIISLFVVFNQAKKHEQEFFRKHIIKKLGSKNEFSQFWKLVKKGKASELKNIWLQKKVKRVQIIKKIFLIVFAVTFLTLIYMWIC